MTIIVGLDIPGGGGGITSLSNNNHGHLLPFQFSQEGQHIRYWTFCGDDTNTSSMRISYSITLLIIVGGVELKERSSVMSKWLQVLGKYQWTGFLEWDSCGSQYIEALCGGHRDCRSILIGQGYNKGYRSIISVQGYDKGYRDIILVR